MVYILQIWRPHREGHRRRRGARGRPSEGLLREGLPSTWGGAGPGPAHEGMNSYSAQEGINSKGNINDI